MLKKMFKRIYRVVYDDDYDTYNVESKLYLCPWRVENRYFYEVYALQEKKRLERENNGN